MGVDTKLKEVNWEKISVYITLTIAFLALVSQLFSIKDAITDIRERVRATEVRIEKIEEKMKSDGR